MKRHFAFGANCSKHASIHASWGTSTKRAFLGALLILLMVAPFAARTRTRITGPRAADRGRLPAAVPAKTAIRPARTSAPKKADVMASYAKLPLAFTPNAGPVNNTAGFSSRGPGYSLFL